MKTIRVDHYPPRGTRYGDVADFWTRGTLVSELAVCTQTEIDEELSRLANRDGFTHWRSVQTGQVLKIRGV